LERTNLINIKMLGRILSAGRHGIRAGGFSMHKFMSGVAAVLISAFGMAGAADSAPIGRAGAGPGAGGLHAFHGAGQFHAPGQSHAARQFRPGFHGYHGFYRGLYPYTLFGYPNYNSYWGYPYSLYDDDSPDCRFEWPKRTVKHKTVQRGVWTCS
jgi:hypothetical protein